MICIFTDGACSTSTRIGGWGFQVVRCGVDDEIMKVASGAKANTTNNEMELTALSQALSWVAENVVNEKIQIFCDSAYIVNCFKEQWYKKWLINGWMSASRTPIKHKELWTNILEKLEQFNKEEHLYKIEIEINKVIAHSGNIGNEAADQLAVSAKELLAASEDK